jgi:hypothetical protein
MLSFDSMESSAEPNEILEINGDRNRRMTLENTRETRENWFKLFDVTEVRRLQASIPLPPVLPPEPPAEMPVQGVWPKNYILLSLLFLAVGILILIDLSFSWLGLAISAFVYLVLLKTPNFSSKNLLKQISVILCLMYTLFVVVLAIFVSGSEIQIIVGLAHISLALGIYLFLIRPWFSERTRVNEHNAQIRTERVSYERILSKNIAANQERERIVKSIDDLTVDVLHLKEMAKLRRELFDRALVDAFAELNVPEDVQTELLGDRESQVLEITKPFLEENSQYGRPLVQFSLGQIPFDSLDTPVLATYLSHLYVVKIALILPQGLGTYEALVDSVELTTRLLGHDLTLWKSISRVIRENASTDWLEDEIVLETYGGSLNRFPVNGSFVNEKLETVPNVRFVNSEHQGEGFELNPRVVNAFVRSVQQKMSL